MKNTTLNKTSEGFGKEKTIKNRTSGGKEDSISTASNEDKVMDIRRSTSKKGRASKKDLPIHVLAYYDPNTFDPDPESRNAREIRQLIEEVQELKSIFKSAEFKTLLRGIKSGELKVLSSAKKPAPAQKKAPSASKRGSRK